MNDVQRLLDFIVEDGDEYIGTLKLNGKTDAIQRMVKASNLSDKIDCTETDIFMTYNTFESKRSRKVTNIKKLNACYIDIDCYDCGLSAAEALSAMKEKAFGRNVPFPSAIIHSGGGLYLIWKINSCSSKNIDTWKKVQRKLCSLLKEYGADEKSLDASHVFRIPSSLNEKHGKPILVTINQITYDAIYSLDLLTQWLNISTTKTASSAPSTPKNTKAKSTKKHVSTHKSNIPYIDYNTYTEMFSKSPRKNTFRQAMGERASDISDILISRGLSVRGMREVGLFWYRVHLILSGKSYETALQMTIDLNCQLALPLSVKEVVQATATAEKMKYVCSTEKLYKMLEVDKNIEHRLKRIVSQQTRIERLRLKRSGRISSKRAEIELRRRTLAKMIDEGYSIEYICCILKISKRTYYYDKSAAGKIVRRCATKVAKSRFSKKTNDNHENKVSVCVYPQSLLHDTTSTKPSLLIGTEHHTLYEPPDIGGHVHTKHKVVIIC